MVSLDFSESRNITDSIEVLGLASCGFGVFVMAVHWIMVWTIPQFRLLKHNDRIYSAKNMAKSIALAAYIPLAVDILCEFVFTDKIDGSRVRVAGTLYACTDIAGLFLVSNHSKTTVFHHITVATLSLYNLTHTIDGIWLGFVIYGSLSTFTFIVNTTLSLRHFVPVQWLGNMCTVSFVIYASSCLVNWVCQLFIIRTRFTFETGGVVFITLLTAIIIDDVVLMRWLLKIASGYYGIC